ncbi:MAG: alpha/beta hydrolase [Acetobacteraceae bacterium]|nr:alpha/beta hydrolase [Acetobacteraceae bacterium]
MKRRARRCFIGSGLLLITGIAGLCGSVLVTGLLLSRPDPAVIGPPPADLPGAETVRIPSASGSVLAGWWIEGMQGGGAVVLMHGIHANRLSMARRAAVLRQHGFSVLLFDFQAHGESAGRHITFGHLEALDAAAAVAFARRRVPEEKIGAIGVSLGGAAALLGATPLPVDALVLESVYPDIDAALSNRLRFHLGPVIGAVFVPILTPLFKWLLPPILGVGPGDLRPLDRIAAATAPLLVASGTLDVHTPIAETAALFARAPDPKQYWPVTGAAHVDLERRDPGAYWRVVTPFLIEWTRR